VLLAVASATFALAGCSAPATPASSAASARAANPTAAAAEYALTGNQADEPMLTYIDPNNQFRFLHPASWARSTPAGEAVRVTGRDQFMSVALISTAQAPLEFAAAETQQLSASSPGYASSGPKAFVVAGARGALLAYTWQAGPSAVTGKPVPSSANRYYIPGPGGKLAVFTYASAANTFDREDSDDFANTFQWLS
jgi:hypothetical protein